MKFVFIWLVVSNQHLSQLGWFFPNIWKIKTGSKPPTRYQYVSILTMSLCHISEDGAYHGVLVYRPRWPLTVQQTNLQGFQWITNGYLMDIQWRMNGYWWLPEGNILSNLARFPIQPSLEIVGNSLAFRSRSHNRMSEGKQQILSISITYEEKWHLPEKKQFRGGF